MSNLSAREALRDLADVLGKAVGIVDMGRMRLVDREVIPKCGGLAESKKIANLAEMYSNPFAPPLVSTPLGTVSACHMCAAIPNFLVMEWHALEEREVWDSYVVPPEGSRSVVRETIIRTRHIRELHALGRRPC